MLKSDAVLTRQRPRPDVGVGPVEGAPVAPAAALPADVDVVEAEAPGHELDAGVGLDLVHGLGDGQPVVLVQVVAQHIGNLAKMCKTCEPGVMKSTVLQSSLAVL